MFCDQFGSGRAGDKHAANHQVSFGRRLSNRIKIGRQRVQPSAKNVVEFTQPVQVQVNDGDVGAHAQGNLGRVCAHNASADDRNRRRRHSRDTAQQHAAPSTFLF